jgi:hypothetical protein
MAITAEYSLVPYDPVRPYAVQGQLPGRAAAAVNRGQPERFRERSPAPRALARPSAPAGFPQTYSARRTVEPPPAFATGLMVDIFV